MRAILMLILVTFFCGYAFGQSNRSTSTFSTSSSSSDDVARCVADVRWSNTNGSLTYSRQLQVPISLSLLTHISKGSSCTNAEVRLTATFLTDSRDFICSGIVANAMTASSEAQTFNIEIRPFTQNDFLRWRNQPGTRGIQQGKRLNCANFDGTSDITDVDRSKATWLHLAVSVLPTGGGLAVVEALVHISP